MYLGPSFGPTTLQDQLSPLEMASKRFPFSKHKNFRLLFSAFPDMHNGKDDRSVLVANCLKEMNPKLLPRASFEINNFSDK